MKKAKAFILCVILILMSFVSMLYKAPLIKADEGNANVYIICLSDVAYHNYGEDSWESKISITKGAIDAVKFGEKDSLPLVHPVLGKSPPYYGVSYQIVSDWNTYKNIIEYCSDVIVINTHGEILPIPSGYNPIEWIGKIACAMLTRRLTWVHTGGYPFYMVWYQGATTYQEWPSGGIYGFKNFTSYINLLGVTCWPPGSQDEKVLLNGEAEYSLIHGWPNVTMASLAERGRPLKASDFKNYTILCIWGTEDYYMTGAVIAFVKPSERAYPETKRGFGAYVHIGTRKTFASGGGETNGDYVRGYIGAAAALWTETEAFRPITHYEEYTEFSGYYYTLCGFMVTPVITYYTYLPDVDCYEIHIDFGIYGFLKSNKSDVLGKVAFDLNSLSSCKVMMWSDASKNGYKKDKPTVNIDWVKVGVFGIKTLLFFISFISIDPYTKLWTATKAIGGIMLFSDFLKLSSTITSKESGVDAWDREVYFEYDPVTCYYWDSSYAYYEFESIIHIECRVNMTGRRQWTIVPIDFGIGLATTEGAWRAVKRSTISIAIFNWYEPTDYVASVFYDDFKIMNDWSVGDSNSLAGYDYWGMWDKGGCVHCAGVGTNSIHWDDPNVDVRGYLWPIYDKCMDSYLQRSVDLRPYRSAWLRCDLVCITKGGDYLTVEAYYNGMWNALATYSGNGPEVSPVEIAIPTAASMIKFRFFSNDDNDVSWGAFIGYVEIKGELPNDANSMTDAGNRFDVALNVGQGNYAGYLNSDEDWYSFSVTSNDLGKYIYFTLSPPSNARFAAELYDPNNVKRTGSSEEINFRLSSTDPVGNWRLRIYPIVGFGQYSFQLKITTSPSTGGGCPFLCIWNGETYKIDNNILPASERSDGKDIGDYYLLQEKPLPIYQGYSTSLYSFQIVEFESEHSYIDQVMFMAVDHEPGTNIAVTQSGEIVTYKNPMLPITCFDNYGNSRLNEISIIDGNISDPSTFFYGEEGDWLILNFGRVDASTANLILRSDMKSADVCIEIQVSTEKGWQTMEIIHPRDYWSIEAVNMTAYIQKGEDLLIRLLWTSPHRLDYVGLDITPQENYTIRKGKLITALHSIEGNILQKIIQNDNIYAELTPGQKILLIFTIPNPKPEKTTDYIFYTEGHYYTIET